MVVASGRAEDCDAVGAAGTGGKRRGRWRRPVSGGALGTAPNDDPALGAEPRVRGQIRVATEAGLHSAELSGIQSARCSPPVPRKDQIGSAVAAGALDPASVLGVPPANPNEVASRERTAAWAVFRVVVAVGRMARGVGGVGASWRAVERTRIPSPAETAGVRT